MEKRQKIREKRHEAYLRKEVNRLAGHLLLEK